MDVGLAMGWGSFVRWRVGASGGRRRGGAPAGPSRSLPRTPIRGALWSGACVELATRAPSEPPNPRTPEPPNPRTPITLSDLLALPRFTTSGAAAYRPGLDRMVALLAALGDPHRAAPVVHVAGTNGKGSTASFVASIASSAGRRVGLHTSPHLAHVGERIRVDGVPADDAWLEDAVARVGEVFERVGPSFFEATVALAFLSFAEHDVDVAVVEVGLGGRLDATNVVAPAVSVVTHIGLDHTDLLGDTLAAVAREKAGIAKPGVPLVHAVTDAEARGALTAEARRRGAAVEDARETCRWTGRRLVTPVRTYDGLDVGLAGAHQRANAALAVRAVERAIPDVTPGAVRAGLREVVQRSGLRGRGEAWSEDPRVILDVAHNADGWAAALRQLDVPEGGALWALVGVMADKDADALAHQLADAGARAIAVGLAGDRALGGEALAAALDAQRVPVETAATVADGLARFRAAASSADRLLVTGSHVTVADALAAGVD